MTKKRHVRRPLSLFKQRAHDIAQCDLLTIPQRYGLGGVYDTYRTMPWKIPHHVLAWNSLQHSPAFNRNCFDQRQASSSKRVTKLRRSFVWFSRFFAIKTGYSWSLSQYTYDSSSEPTTDPPEPNSPEDIGDGLQDVPDPCCDSDPGPWETLRTGEAMELRGGWPFTPPGTDEPPPPPDLHDLLPLERLFLYVGFTGSSSAAAASKNAAAWGWLWRSAVACAVIPEKSRLRSLGEQHKKSKGVPLKGSDVCRMQGNQMRRGGMNNYLTLGTVSVVVEWKPKACMRLP